MLDFMIIVFSSVMVLSETWNKISDNIDMNMCIIVY